MAQGNIGLTLLQHEVIGTELQKMRDQLVSLCVTISNAYGVTKSRKAVRACTRAYEQIDILRSELDDFVCQEHPNDSTVTRTYFSGSDSENKIIK